LNTLCKSCFAGLKRFRMHGWLYVEMASLFVSRIVAELKVVTVLTGPGHSLLSFFFPSVTWFEATCFEIAIILIS
jgi:hypothetical protein